MTEILRRLNSRIFLAKFRPDSLLDVCCNQRDNYTIRSSVVFALHQIFQGDKITVRWAENVASMERLEERKNFGWKA